MQLIKSYFLALNKLAEGMVAANVVLDITGRNCITRPIQGAAVQIRYEAMIPLFENGYMSRSGDEDDVVTKITNGSFRLNSGGEAQYRKQAQAIKDAALAILKYHSPPGFAWHCREIKYFRQRDTISVGAVGVMHLYFPS